MKSTRNFLIGIFIGGGLIVGLHLLHAQEMAASSQGNPVLLPASTVDSMSDLEVLLRTVELLPTAPAAAAPGAGTFWSAQHAPGTRSQWPPLPGNIRQVPVWNLGDGVYLLDDLQVDYSLPVSSRVSGGGMRAMDDSGGPFPGDGGGGGGDKTNGFYSDSFNFNPDYGTNLYIAQVNVASNNFSGIVSNSFADIQYEIQYTTDLTQTNWQSANWFVYGSELTNWTPFSVPGVSPTNLFLRVRSWQDDGSGLPIWWQEQYFGTTGVDPNAQDPAGDGWTIWQKFQMGANPNIFVTPPTPQGVTAQFNPNNSSQIILTWQPNNGPVTGYTITRFDYSNWQWTYFYVGVTNEFVDTNFPAYTDANADNPSVYQIQADYAGGNSSWNYGTVPYSPAYAPYVIGIPGASGAFTLLVNHIPPGVSSMRLIRNDGGGATTNMVFPVSDFTNGIFTIPSALTYPGSPEFYLQAVWPDGSKSAPVSPALTLDYLPPPFFDGRTQMEQNVSFLLQAASLTNSFSYVLDGYYGGQVNEPNNYTYASLYNVVSSTGAGLGVEDGVSQNWQRPFAENYGYRNFLYLNNTNLNSSGFLNTDIYFDGNGTLHLPSAPVFQFSAPTNSTTIPALDVATYGQPYTDYHPLGIYVNGSGQFVLPNNIYNWFGLHLSSVLLAHNHAGTLHLDSLSAGGTWPATSDTYYYYPQFDAPVLQTVGYYFGRMVNEWNEGYDGIAPDLLPGDADFSPTNQQPLLIAGVGQPVQIAAFARKIVTNGDTSKPVYVAQYFDKAYKVDGNGNVTSTQTGMLSPWGDFTPTEPGSVALVTMPDITTGQRGTGVVYCVSLVLDANHDGIMDLSYTGPDSTPGYDPYFIWYGSGYEESLPQSFNFWINNGTNAPGVNGGLDHDLPVPPNNPGLANSAAGKITCQRDLENLARLWIRGLPNLSASQGYSVTLEPNQTFNNPAINLYAACESDGGTGYLTDTNVAATQINSTHGNRLGQVGSGGTYTLPVDSNGQPLLTNFLFEGVSPGQGNLALTIYKNGQPIAQTFAYLNLQDIKSFYEQAAVTNVIQYWPAMVQQPATSGFEVLNSPPPNAYDANQLAVFVHGWRMTQWDWQDFSDTMFKRLYWQGYQGRFASLRWPTRSKDTDTNSIFGIPADMLTFDRSEHIAFESGTGAAAYFNNLRQRFTNDTISVTAHSLGNIVMMEALKELAASNQSPLDNYVMMQAAVSASCYDTTLPSLSKFTDQEQRLATPNTYSGYGAGIDNALRGKIVNFFNTNDYALATATTNESVPLFGGYYISITIGTSWEDGQLLTKPLFGFGYSYNPTNSTAYLTNVNEGVTGRIVTDPRELMPFVARTRTKAVGAQSGVGQMVNGGELDLKPLGFTKESYDHSGQFNRNIQDPVVNQFYTNLVLKLFP